MIKLIASDMDGTLLTAERKLPVDFFDVLEKLKKSDVSFVIASGRSYSTLLRDFNPHSDSMDYICDNGAFIVINGKVTKISKIDPKTVHEIISFCEKLYNVGLLLCGVNGTYHLKFKDMFNSEINHFYVNNIIVENLLAVTEIDDIFKIAVCDYKGAKCETLPQLISKFGDNLTIQLSGDYYVDIMNKGVNKGAALKEIQENLNISTAETMAFGDYYNDIELLSRADFSYVMENANEDMFQYGKFIAKSNTENGVLQIIKEFVLK